MTDRRDRVPPDRRSRGRRFRRALVWGIAASVALHLAVLAFWPAGPRSDRPPAPDRRDSPEQPRGIRAVDLRTAPAAGDPSGRVSVQVPTPSRRGPGLQRMEPVSVETPSFPWAAPGGSASGGGPGGRTGVTDGRRPGDDGFTPPMPRSLLPDWSPPEEVRGHQVTVRVEVDQRGRPTGRVELVPPTPSESFNRELRRRMTRLEFVPARRDGRPVSGWAEITFTFGEGRRIAGSPR